MAERYARIPESTIRCREMSATDWRVYAAIALHADSYGRAYPGMTTIALISGVRRQDVPRTISRLEKLGLLRREPRAGPNGANLYSIDRASVLVRTVRNAADPQHNGEGVRRAAAKMSASVRTKQTKEQNTEYKRGQRGVRAVDGDRENVGEFEAFWAAFPSRKPLANPKQLARKKFEAAAKRGIPPQAIIRGAANYRASVQQAGTETRYVVQAATWLHQERWADYQDSPEPPLFRVGMN